MRTQKQNSGCSPVEHLSHITSERLVLPHRRSKEHHIYPLIHILFLSFHTYTTIDTVYPRNSKATEFCDPKSLFCWLAPRQLAFMPKVGGVIAADHFYLFIPSSVSTLIGATHFVVYGWLLPGRLLNSDPMTALFTSTFVCVLDSPSKMGASPRLLCSVVTPTITGA